MSQFDISHAERLCDLQEHFQQMSKENFEEEPNPLDSVVDVMTRQLRMAIARIKELEGMECPT